MSFQPPYAYLLQVEGQPPVVFTWPNVVKKYIRDTYTMAGVLSLPPKGYLSLKRHKINPKAGQAAIVDTLDIEAFLSAP